MGGFFLIGVGLWVLFFIYNKHEFEKRQEKILGEVNDIGWLNFYYSLGAAMFATGLMGLFFLYGTYYIGNSDFNNEIFTRDSLIFTVVTSVGLGFAIYRDQKVEKAFEKIELIETLSNSITEKLIEHLSEKNFEDLSDKIAEKTADNITLKLRARPLRKKIAKQIVKKYKKRKCFF